MQILYIVLLILLALLVILGIILLIVAIIEPHKLDITHTEMNEEGSDADLNICFISDLHAEMCFIDSNIVIDAINSENKIRPIDCVVFGGDICNNPKKVSKGIGYLNKIASFCSDNSIPFVGVNGNHDVEIPQSEIDKCGFKDLSTNSITIPGRYSKKDYFITGVKDSGRKHRVWYEVKDAPESTYKTVLISHNPDQLLNLNGKHIDYCISGHIHGGQIRTPFKIEFNHLRPDILPKKGYFAGKYNYNGIKLYIGRGLGCIRLPLRLKAKPELSFITFSNS